MHDRLLYGALAQAPPLLLLLAGSLAAQDSVPRWYGHLVLRNAVLELYVADHPSWGRTPVVAVCSAQPPLLGQCWRFEMQAPVWYANRMREALTKLAAGETLAGTRVVPDRGTIRGHCSAAGCALTVLLAGRPESLRTAPAVDTARLRRYADALEAAGKRDTTFRVIRDSLP